jgi:hypothetical protein
MTIPIDEDTYDALRKIAYEQNVYLVEIIRAFLLEGLKKYSNKKET